MHSFKAFTQSEIHHFIYLSKNQIINLLFELDQFLPTKPQQHSENSNCFKLIPKLTVILRYFHWMYPIQ